MLLFFFLKPHVNKTRRKTLPKSQPQGAGDSRMLSEVQRDLMVSIWGYRITFFALLTATVKVAERCRVVSSSLSLKPSSLVWHFASPLTTTTTTSINPRDASNTLFHRIKLNIKSLGALAVTGAAELGLENTDSSSRGQFVATLSSFKSNVGLLLLVFLRVG